MDPHELFDDKLGDLIQEAASFDIQSDEASAAMKNLKIFSECRPPAPTPEPEPEPELVPKTTKEKVLAGVACVLDSETTRTVIKAAGAFAGVALVVYTTIHRDHVIERTSLAQANQKQ